MDGTRKIKKISYFGFADAAINDPLYKEAYELAKFLTSKGYQAINGGGPGTMRAVSEGARAAGGNPIGVTFYPKDISNFEGRDPENPVGEEIKTDSYLARTLKLLEEGDGYVVFKGGTGTISEFGMAWGLARLYFGHHKPLILYGDFWHNIITAFSQNMRIRPEELRVFKIVSNNDETLKALEYFEEMIQYKENPDKEESPFELHQ